MEIFLDFVIDVIPEKQIQTPGLSAPPATDMLEIVRQFENSTVQMIIYNVKSKAQRIVSVRPNRN